MTYKDPKYMHSGIIMVCYVTVFNFFFFQSVYPTGEVYVLSVTSGLEKMLLHLSTAGIGVGVETDLPGPHHTQ